MGDTTIPSGLMVGARFHTRTRQVENTVLFGQVAPATLLLERDGIPEAHSKNPIEELYLSIFV
jgi:hypothetical protein